MKEQSHLDAMRAAVRGDLERARARRGPVVPEREPEPDVTPEPERAEPRRGFFSSLFRRG